MSAFCCNLGYTNHNMELAQKIHAVLFYKGIPMSYTQLAGCVEADINEVKEAVKALQNKQTTEGVVVITTDSEVTLATNPACDVVIESLRREELKRDIGKAGAETLAIILYKGPVTRAEIDRIRGVNSSFIVRNLLTRGLVSKTETKHGTELSASTALFMHLGIQYKSELPEYSRILDELEKFEGTET